MHICYTRRWALDQSLLSVACHGKRVLWTAIRIYFETSPPTRAFKPLLLERATITRLPNVAGQADHRCRGQHQVGRDEDVPAPPWRLFFCVIWMARSVLRVTE